MTNTAPTAARRTLASGAVAELDELGRVVAILPAAEAEAAPIPVDFAAGDRVRVLPGALPSTFGTPLAVVVRVNPTTATVRLMHDGAERRIDLEALELRHTAAEVRRLGVETDLELELFPAVELEAPAELEAPVVVIPCGGGKVAHRAPAGELYTGSYFAAMLRAALALTSPDRVRILSGRYGFVALDTELEPYEQRIDEAGAITPAELEAQVAGDELLAGAGRVVVLAGRAYAERAAAALEGAVVELPFAGARGIGDQLARAKVLAA